MRVRWLGATASAAARASARALTSIKQTGPKGRQRHQIDLAGMGLDAAAQDAMALAAAATRPPGSRRDGRAFRRLSSGAFSHSSSPGRGHKSPCASASSQARDHFGGRLDRHEGQRRVQRRIDRARNRSRRAAAARPAGSLRPWARRPWHNAPAKLGQGAAPHFFMQLGHFARHRGGARRPESAAMSARLSARRWAGFEKDQGGAHAFQFFQRASALARLGRTESPRTETGRTAGPTAPAPSAPPRRRAWHGPAMPSSIAARTSLKPGSETSGVPASLTRAMRAPSLQPRQQAAAARGPHCDRYRRSAAWRCRGWPAAWR